MATPSPAPTATALGATSTPQPTPEPTALPAVLPPTGGGPAGDATPNPGLWIVLAGLIAIALGAAGLKFGWRPLH